MRFSDKTILRYIRAKEGVEFSRYGRWILVFVIAANLILPHFGLWDRASEELLVIAVVYLIVGWPGLVRATVFDMLDRYIEEDPETQSRIREGRVNRGFLGFPKRPS